MLAINQLHHGHMTSSVTIVKRPTTLLVFIIKHFPWKFELASSPKHNEAVKTFFFFVCSVWWWLMSLTTSVVPLGHLLIKHDNIFSLTLNLSCVNHRPLFQALNQKSIPKTLWRVNMWPRFRVLASRYTSFLQHSICNIVKWPFTHLRCTYIVDYT